MSCMLKVNKPTRERQNMAKKITADDHTNAFALLQDLNSKANGVINSVEGLLGKVKQDKLNTAKRYHERAFSKMIGLHSNGFKCKFDFNHFKKALAHLIRIVSRYRDPQLQGVSFLEVKNQLMLDYLTNLTLLMQAKLHGKSIEGHVAIPNLVEIRTFLEKMRPIDQKLKYQIDKLVKTAATGSVGENDPLRFKPNPDNMEEDGDSTSEDENNDEKGGSKVYKPPKVAAMHYTGDETAKERLQQDLKKTQRRALSKSIMKDLREEYYDGPEEMMTTESYHKVNENDTLKERREYEEKYFVRMSTEKKEKADARNILSRSGLNELTQQFGDHDSSADTRRKSDSKGKKRKTTKGRGKKGGGKKRKKH